MKLLQMVHRIRTWQWIIIAVLWAIIPLSGFLHMYEIVTHKTYPQRVIEQAKTIYIIEPTMTWEEIDPIVKGARRNTPYMCEPDTLLSGMYETTTSKIYHGLFVLLILTKFLYPKPGCSHSTFL